MVFNFSSLESILQDRIQYLRGKNKKQGEAPRALRSECAPWVLQQDDIMFSVLAICKGRDRRSPPVSARQILRWQLLQNSRQSLWSAILHSLAV